MAFLAKTDIERAIKADMLDALLESDDTVITAAADEAEGKASEYLSGNIDIATEFAKTGTDRHKLLLAYCIDIAIYNIWRYIDPMQIPAPRVTAYNEAIEWLKGVMSGDVSTTLTSATEGDESGGTLYFLSNDKRGNHY